MIYFSREEKRESHFKNLMMKYMIERIEMQVNLIVYPVGRKMPVEIGKTT